MGWVGDGDSVGFALAFLLFLLTQREGKSERPIFSIVFLQLFAFLILKLTLQLIN